jgi:hypothetical protein
MKGGNPLLARDLPTDLEPSDPTDYDAIDGNAYDDNGVPADVLDDLESPEFYDDDDDDVFIDMSNEIDDGDAFAGGCAKPGDNKAKNQLPATKDEVLRGSHREADLKELRSFHSNGALGPRIINVTPDIMQKTFTAGWRRTWKGDADERTAKSRLYVRGFQDRRDRGWIETHAGTADPGLERISHIYALHRKWRAAKVDISTAFLQAESDAELYVRLPPDIPPEAAELGYVPGGIYRQLKAIYGRIDAPNIFSTGLSSKLDVEGWKNIAEAIYVQSSTSKQNVTNAPAHQGVLRTHMDDLFCNSDDPVAKLEALKKHYKMGPITELKSGEWGVYTGLEIRWDGERGVAEHAQKQYADGIDTKLTNAEARRRFGAKDLELTKDEDINVGYQKEHQSWTGMLGWLAKTQRFLSVVFSMVSRNSNRPSAESVLSAKRACEYAKEYHVPLKFNAVRKPVLLWWVDGSYSIATCEGRTGWELQVVDENEVDEAKFDDAPRSNVVAWRSHRQVRKLASSSSSELMALVEAVKLMPMYTKHVEHLWGCEPKVYFLTDSQPLLGWLRTKWITSDPKLQGMLDLVVDRLGECGSRVKVMYVRTDIQRADKHTKFIHASKLQLA